MKESALQKVKLAITEALKAILARLDEKDDEFLYSDVLAGLMLHKDYTNTPTFGNNTIEWALDRYTAVRIGNLSDGLLKLHESLVKADATAKNPFDYENVDRYGAYFANTDEFKSMAFKTQSYTYMVVLVKQNWYPDIDSGNIKQESAWNVHIRYATKGRYSMDYALVDFNKLGFLNDPVISDMYKNDCAYFRCHDGRDQGYLCSVTHELMSDEWKTSDTMINFKMLSGIHYDVGCHISMLGSLEMERDTA